jgi:hypothetical protein
MRAGGVAGTGDDAARGVVDFLDAICGVIFIGDRVRQAGNGALVALDVAALIIGAVDEAGLRLDLGDVATAPVGRLDGVVGVRNGLGRGGRVVP